MTTSEIVDEWKFPLFVPDYLHFGRVARETADGATEDGESRVFVHQLFTLNTTHLKDLLLFCVYYTIFFLSYLALSRIR